LRPNPDQPRRTIDPSTVLELAADIRQHGVMQPILVAPADEGGMHMIIAGERRWRAAQQAELAAVDVLIDYDLRDPGRIFDAALAENIQREDLTRTDLAAALLHVKEREGLRDEDLAARCHKSMPWVRQMLAFGALPQESQQFMEVHGVPLGLAKALRPLEPEVQLDVLNTVRDFPSRDRQLQHISEAKAQLREPASLARTTGATDFHGAPTDKAPPPRRSLVLPFALAEHGRQSGTIECHPGSLATTRLSAKRRAEAWEWEEAILQDVIAYHDATLEDEGAEEAWRNFSARLLQIVGPSVVGPRGPTSGAMEEER